MMAATHDLADFVDGVLYFVDGSGARGNTKRILLLAKLLEISREWNDDPIVERSAE